MTLKLAYASETLWNVNFISFVVNLLLPPDLCLMEVSSINLCFFFVFFFQNEDLGWGVRERKTGLLQGRGSAWLFKGSLALSLLFCLLNLLSPGTSRGKWIDVCCGKCLYFSLFSSGRKSTKGRSSTISFWRLNLFSVHKNDSYHKKRMSKIRKHKVSVGYEFFSNLQWYLPNVSDSAPCMALASQKSHIIVIIK